MSKKSTLKKKKTALLLIAVVVGVLFLTFGTELFERPLFVTQRNSLNMGYDYVLPQTTVDDRCNVENPDGAFWDFKGGSILWEDGILQRSCYYSSAQNRNICFDARPFLQIRTSATFIDNVECEYYTVNDIEYRRRDNGQVVKRILWSYMSDDGEVNSPDYNLYPGCVDAGGCELFFNVYYYPCGYVPQLEMPVQDITNNPIVQKTKMCQCEIEGDISRFGGDFYTCENSAWKILSDLQVEDLREQIQIQASLITSLGLSIDEQVVRINSLQLTLDEKIILVQDLELNIQEQSEMINKLATNLQEKADLVSQLQVTNEDQAELIALMGLSFSDQSDIINALNKEVSDDAEIIGNLNLNIQDQAKVIDGLELTVEEEGIIIANLELSLLEESQIIEDLRVTIAEKQRLIDSLNQEKIALEKAIEDQLRLNIIYIVSFVVVIIGLLVFYFLTKKKKRGRR